MLPGIIQHLGPEGVHHLKKMAMANNVMAANSRVLSTLGEEDDDIPSLVQNFEQTLSAVAGSSEVNIDEAIGGVKAPVEVVD